MRFNVTVCLFAAIIQNNSFCLLCPFTIIFVLEQRIRSLIWLTFYVPDSYSNKYKSNVRRHKICSSSNVSPLWTASPGTWSSGCTLGLVCYGHSGAVAQNWLSSVHRIPANINFRVMLHHDLINSRMDHQYNFTD